MEEIKVMIDGALVDLAQVQIEIDEVKTGDGSVSEKHERLAVADALCSSIIRQLNADKSSCQFQRTAM